MTKPLPCINAQQFAAKVISKDQQSLDIVLSELAANTKKVKVTYFVLKI